MHISKRHLHPIDKKSESLTSHDTNEVEDFSAKRSSKKPKMKKVLLKLSKLESSVLEQSLKYDDRVSSLESKLKRVMHKIGISYIQVKIVLFKSLIN